MSSQNDNPYASPVADYLPPLELLAGRLATRGERFAGALIDALIVNSLVFGAGMLLGFALLALGLEPGSLATQITATVAGAILGAGIFLTINGHLLATRGQTVGKVVMKTRIVSDDDQLVPFGPLVLKRYLPLWAIVNLPFVGGFFALADALAIFRENHKCLHDDLAGTKVIKLGIVERQQPRVGS